MEANMVRKTGRKARTSPKSKNKASKSRAPAKKSHKTSGGSSRARKAGAARKPAASHARPQPEHESVWGKLFKRVKPLFSKPLDPRIKQLVEVFGEEAVR